MQEDDNAGVFAIQQEEQQSSGSRREVTNNPGLAVPMSPTKSKAPRLFVSESVASPARLDLPVGSPELFEVDDENMPNADDLAFLDDRETDVMMNEY